MKKSKQKRVEKHNQKLKKQGKLLTFEDCYDEIIKVINRHKFMWNLKAKPDIEWKDIRQIILTHIYVKWEKFDQTKKLSSWLFSVCRNQIYNLVRNNYYNFARPCLRCPFARDQEENGCGLYGQISDKCRLIREWNLHKRQAHNTKLPLPLCHHELEVFDLPSEEIDIEKNATEIHEKMKEVLKPQEWRAYRLLYIEHKSEEETAIALGYKSNEKGRAPGYKMLRIIQKNIIKKVKEFIYSSEFDIL